MRGVLERHHLGDIARELPDGVEVGVTFDRSHHVDAPGAGGLQVCGQAELVEHIGDCACRRSYHREVAARRI